MRLLATIALVMVLTACAGVKPGPVALSATEYEMPIASEKLQPAPGKDSDKLLAEIIVPASAKPTRVQVYKQPKGLLAAKGAAGVSVVSDNPAVTVAQPARWPWWWKGLALLAGPGAGGLVWLKVSGPIKVFFGGAWALVRRIFR